ncbi:RagB/SusD family nutrient uptake outer membrane protein [Proteiniphilum sp. X52]|uniref:RagB/SusD family nutrient uptake outer membrane protein n=1 Tax=Proteiniphilum sp. X52 TaxID=2382159 RepID=UPI000F0A85D2|nr:RagB/SusD family nutrient uptake outer membrane protein [Proteiniphilum sp. X52]RNC64413.1 RagB/SusD family nutrient uptake outer membrane protein [Proteiniphilum sp. X52]
MKTTHKYTGVLLFMLLLLWMVSCNDFLTEDPKGRMATQTFFSERSDLDASLNALYFIVADAQYANHYTGTNFLAGDDITTHPASNKQSLREHDQFGVSDNNAWMPYLWEQRWKIIKAANFIINNAGRTPEASDEEIKSAIANASYWRAFAYFYLVTTWGPVPVMLEEEINYDAQLQSVEKIYELIIQDLKMAEENCPASYTKAPYARNGMNIAVSQGAVKATMAYVYMAMAGWPLNKGTEYYRLAAEKAKEVIDGVENGTYYYTLLDEYWKVYSWEFNDNNPEVLLGVYYNRDRKSNMSSACDFLQDMKQGGWGDTNGEIKFWKEFPEGPRKEATYFPKIMLSDGKLYDWWYDTDPPSRAVVAPVFMKTVEGAVRGTEFDYSNPSRISSSGEKQHQVIRLSQVYCWYAEAIGRSGQVNTKAIEVLNKVRNRADGKESNIYHSGMTPEELAEAAYNEHGWEIAGYYWGGLASRARDMFRMYRYKDHFEFRKENPLIEVAPGVFRKEGVPVTGAWDDGKMYIPYPYKDVILNPNLKQ